MKKPSLAWLGLVVALAGCQTQTAPIQKNFLGFIDVQFSGAGAQAKASLKAVGANPQTRGLNDIASGLQYKPLSNGAFDTGTRGTDGKRYLWASFKVRNADQTGTPYTVARNNVSFVAVSMPSTIDQTAISTLNKFDGSPASTSIARTILPTHGMELDLSSRKPSVRKNTEDLQFFTELEASALGAGFTGVDSVLPYGYVMRNIAGSSRNLPANPSVGDYAGTVTFAVQMPLQATSAADPFYISMRLAVVEDSQTTVSKSREETVSSAKTRASALSGSVSRSACAGVRVAGNTPAAVGNTVMTDSPTSGQLDYCSFGKFGIQDAPQNSTVIALDNLGRTVMSIYSYSSNATADFKLQRLNPDGSLDLSFGTAGVVNYDSGLQDFLGAITVQADNKILVANSLTDYGISGSPSKVQLIRFNTDGSLDTTFGGSSSGYVTDTFNATNTGVPHDTATSLLVLPDQSIIVAGQATDRTATGDINAVGLLKFTSTGVLDSSFDGDGRVQTDFNAACNRDTAVTLVNIPVSNKLVVGVNCESITGVSDYKEGLIQYNANGSLDTSFATGGILTLSAGLGDLSATLRDVQYDNNGKLLYLRTFYTNATSDSDYQLFRFNGDGTPDTTFATAGVLKLDVSGSGFYDRPSNLLLQTDGKILMVGQSNIAANSGFSTPVVVATVRLETNGALDTTYGMSGIQKTDISGFNDNNIGNAVLDNANKIGILSAGSDPFGGGTVFLISRFVP